MSIPPCLDVLSTVAERCCPPLRSLCFVGISSLCCYRQDETASSYSRQSSTSGRSPCRELGINHHVQP